MTDQREPVVILMADDDEDDRQLAREALAEARIVNPIRTVSDGEELLAYLNRSGPYEEPGSAPRPGLILLDLNMPRVDGREALSAIKGTSELRSIPVVVLTTSAEEEDIVRTYDLGVAGYVQKPVSFKGLVSVMEALGHYWFEMVRLPTEG